MDLPERFQTPFFPSTWSYVMAKVIRRLRPIKPAKFGILLAFCCLLLLFYYDSTINYQEQTYLGQFLSFILDEQYSDANCTIPAYRQIWDEYLGGQPYWFKCDALFDGDQEHIDHYNETGRITIDEPPILSMDCPDIRARVIGNQHFKKHRHPYAIARNVFQEYYLQEVLLAFSYSPYNLYCYAVDLRANTSIYQSLITLSKCIPNVIVLKQKYAFNSWGHYQDAAHLDCIKALLPYRSWEYILLLQNHDIMLKTPGEVSTVIDIMDGMPLIDLEDLIRNRIPKAKAWTPRALKLFKPYGDFTLKQEIAKIIIRKSTHQCLLSRDFCEELTNRLDLNYVLSLFNKRRLYGIDEMLIPTLITSSFMGLPGQIENYCKTPTALRYARWNWDNLAMEPCLSGKKRHGVCLLGVEYLPQLANVQALFANKVWPSVDFGAIMCIGEMMYDRDMRGVSTVDRDFYNDLPQVREQRDKKNREFNPAEFECT